MQAVMLPVTNGPGTIVDEDIAEEFKDKKLQLRGKANPYASFSKDGRTEYLHRHIMKAPKGMMVDHKNGHILDNRRSNLRLVTNRENIMNQNAPTKSRSGFRLVYFAKTKKRCWKLRFYVRLYTMRSFTFSSRFVAALLADQFLRENFSEPGRLNFPHSIHRDSLRSFIATTCGRFFKVVFSQRSDGQQRIMVCRIDGPSARWSDGQTYDPNDHNLVRVYDVKSRGFRLIPLEGVLCLSSKGKNYAVTP
jgi:hypothetical protein